MTQTVNITKLAIGFENLLRPFSSLAKIFREGAEQFNDLRNVVVIFAVLGA